MSVVVAIKPAVSQALVLPSKLLPKLHSISSQSHSCLPKVIESLINSFSGEIWEDWMVVKVVQSYAIEYTFKNNANEARWWRHILLIPALGRQRQVDF
jgi:type II secretory pathway component PulF